MHERARSNHEAIAMASRINAVLEIGARVAIPDIIEEWPEGISRTHIPFGTIKADRMS